VPTVNDGTCVSLVVGLAVVVGGRDSMAQDSSALAGAAIEEFEVGPNVGTQPTLAADRPVEPITDLDRSRFHAMFRVDYATKYFGRGIVAETEGLIVQPYADFALDLCRSEDFTLIATLGTWHSIHNRRSTAATTDSITSHWFESDVYAGVGASVGEWALDARYYWYTSPSGAFETIEEVYFSAAFDDSEYLGELAINPTAVLTFETTANQADGGTRKGSYLQLGVAPGLTFDFEQFKDVTVSFPITLGVSLSNYYEGPTGQNDLFGYTSLGATIDVPLPMDSSWGSWKISGGVQALLLGSAAAATNNDNDTEIIATFGVEASF
jgi:hypothetical protein